MKKRNQEKPLNIKGQPIFILMLGQRRRHCPNIDTTLDVCWEVSSIADWPTQALNLTQLKNNVVPAPRVCQLPSSK